MTNELFAGRYQLLGEAPKGAGGRLFEARDTESDEIVAVKVFIQPLPPKSPERADLEAVFARVRALDHPHLAEYLLLEIDEGYLVREWMNGFSLLELLRRRRELSGAEAITLLHGVPEAIDLARGAGIAGGQNYLERLLVAFDRGMAADKLEALRAEKVGDWPHFVVKLNPLVISTFLPTSEEDAMNTMVNVRPKAMGLVTPPAAFASMLYELLGGPHIVGEMKRYTPLAALNEGANAVLRRVLSGREVPSDCVALWQELLGASGLKPLPRKAAPPPLPARRLLTIPAALMGGVQPGTMLKVTPGDITCVPIHLIARPKFKIGRSLYQADFIARVLPETPDNEKLTKEIGRVHVLAEMVEDRLFLRDGNGEQASVNGSSFDGKPLSAEEVLPLDHPGVLALYRNYEMSVEPLHEVHDLGWKIVNEKEWHGPNEPDPAVRGAVAFRPRRGQTMLRNAVWIFTRLDFSVSEKGEPRWVEAGGPESEASFLHHRGQFWLANFSLSKAPVLEGVNLEPNQTAPLTNGQVLLLGAGRYTIEIH